MSRHMKHFRFALRYGLLSLVCTLSSHAGEYFVSPRGSDAYDGSSLVQAFATIQRGVDVLEPGDVLTIAPGEYRESIFRNGLGSSEVDTVIRAAIPGTVVLRGDISVGGFRRVPHLQRVYVTDWDGPVESVHEIDSRFELSVQPALEELDASPGCFFYDAERGLLYVSTSDFAPPHEHQMTVSVDRNHGLFLDNPSRVHIEGLVVRGYTSLHQTSWTPGQQCYWGIIMRNATDCVIRGCIAFANGGGIAIRSDAGGGNVIEDCIAYGNSSSHSAEGGNIIFFSPRSDVIRNCLSYRANGNGIRLYGSKPDLKDDEGSIIEGSISWGNRGPDIFVKGGGVAQLALTRNSVASDKAHAANIENVLIGGDNQYLRYGDAPKNSIYLRNERLDVFAEFADPYNHDYRLQATSSLRGSGPDGSDRGPFPYAEDVYFLRSDGSDAAAGTSVAEAWQTLGHAFSRLRPGDTLYVGEGAYAVAALAGIQGSVDSPVNIRARGTDTVVFEGRLAINSCAGIRFERIQFAGGVAVDGSDDIHFTNSRFFDAETGLSLSASDGVRVTNCAFSGFATAALAVDGCRGLFLRGNSFDNSQSVALAFRGGVESECIAFCDYNGYASASRIAVSDGQVLDLAAWREEGNGRHSVIAKVPTDRVDGVPVARRSAEFVARDGLGNTIGVHHEPRQVLLHMTQPQVASVTATTANIEWVLSGFAYCDIAWGTTPECENEGVSMNPFDNGDTFNSYSLTGLEPDTTYYFRVSRVYLPNHQLSRGHSPPELAEEHFETISFTTAAADPAPRTLYVSTEGDDSAGGESLRDAWRTIRYAAEHVRPGDTVMISGGIYHERVRLRVTGESGKPITFRAAAGERVVLDGNQRMLDRAILASNKSNIRIQDLYFRGYALTFWHTGAVSFINCDDIQVTGCIYDGRGAGYPAAFLNANDTGDLLIADCIIASGIFGIGVRGGRGDTIIENNVFLRNMIEATKLSFAESGMGYVRNNIFTDSMPDKRGVGLHEWGRYERIVADNNLYFTRIPDEERKIYWLMNYRGPKHDIDEDASRGNHYRTSIAGYQKDVEPNTSFVADAEFTGLQSEAMQEEIRKFEELNEVDNRHRFPPDLFISRQHFPELRFEDFRTVNAEYQQRGIGHRR